MPPKVKFFGWLALHKRLWTSARRKRHGLQDTDDCALCAQAPESLGHLFLDCTLARRLWHALLSPIDLGALVPDQEEDLATWWLRQRKRVDKESRPSADSIFLLVAWNLWKHRNDLVFGRRAAPDLISLCVDTTREAEDWAQAGYSSLFEVSQAWSRLVFVL